MIEREDYILKTISADLCESFFNASRDILLYLDVDGTILDCNRQFLKTFGYRKEDVIGKRCFEIVHKDKYHISDCPLLRARQSRTREEKEMQIGDKVFRISVDPIFDNQENISGFVHIATDITHYKRLISALEESEKKFRELFESLRDGVLIMKEIFIDANNRMAQIFGCRKEDIIGKKPADFSPQFQPDGSDSLTKSNSLINMALSGVEQEFYWQHTDIKGNLIDTIVHLMKITISKDDLLIATVRDISEQLYYEKIKKTIDDKINLLGKAEIFQNIIPGIIHDLNNSVMVATGYIDLLKDDTQLKNPIFLQLVNSFEKINKFSESLIHIISDRTEKLIEIDINTIIKDIIKWVYPKQKENIQIIFDKDKEKLLITGYSLRLQQIVMNLLINSIESIGNRGGEIRIKTGVRFYSFKELERNLIKNNLAEGNYAYIRVEDNGCGMSEDTLKRMFEPFFTTKTYGKGLGMLSVRNSIEAHNGGLFASSAEQRGTTFEVILPVNL